MKFCSSNTLPGSGDRKGCAAWNRAAGYRLSAAGAGSEQVVERAQESFSFEHLLSSRPVLILVADLTGSIDQE
jgi:hypothetical protein